MDPSGTCHNGHPLAAGAVYCTVCWVRVEPQDPAVEIARRRRARRIWIPFFTASALLIGVAVGGVLGLRSVGYTPTFVAQDLPALAPVDESASTQSDPVAVAAAPLAATVVETSPSGEGCLALVLDQTAPCAQDQGGLALAFCAPVDTEAVTVSSRATKAAGWQAIPATATIGGDECGASAVTTELLIPTQEAGVEGTAWRILGRDADGQKLWSSRLVVSNGS